MSAGRVGRIYPAGYRRRPSLVPQCGAGFAGVLPTVQHPIHDRGTFGVEAVIDSPRKAPGKHPVKPENLPMNARVERQRINVGEERVEEIVAHALALLLIKIPPIRQVLAGGGEEVDFHTVFWRSSSFTRGQSSTSSKPSANRRSVSARASACHAGEATSAPPRRLNSCHSVSIRRNFSA